MSDVKIMLVEDENITALALQERLEEWGYVVPAVVSTGAQAIQKAEEITPDLVLMDINLKGDMDGIEAAEQIRARFDIPVIYVTAYADEHTLQRAKITEPYGYILKPFEERELHIIIEMALYKHQTEKELRQHRDHLEELVKERTAELSRSNEQLKREIAERKRVEKALRQAKETVETANYAKSAFLANMSHEFRTPLNGILGYAQILQDAPNLTDVQKSQIDRLKHSGDRLLTLVNDILDISKLEAQQIELHESDFQFPEFLTGVSNIAQEQTRQKGLLFYYEADPGLPAGVHGDEQRLRQVLLCLLGNAVRFTEQGEVTFKVRSESQGLRSDVNTSEERHSEDSVPDYERIRFQIEDTGIGIPEDQLENIFLPFKQVAENTKKIDGGAGLGLAISRRIIRLMGGDLHVESSPGKGSTFWFELALTEVAGAVEQKKESEIPKPQPEVEHESILPPPVEELTSLYNLALMGDIFEIRERIGEIDKSDLKFASFTARIRNLAKDLKLLEIQRFLRQYLED